MREDSRDVAGNPCPVTRPPIESEAELAWELFLPLHAIRERLTRLETKLGVRTARDAVARAVRGARSRRPLQFRDGGGGGS